MFSLTRFCNKMWFCSFHRDLLTEFRNEMKVDLYNKKVLYTEGFRNDISKFQHRHCIYNSVYLPLKAKVSHIIMLFSGAELYKCLLIVKTLS